MSVRLPSSIIVVDANILVRAGLGSGVAASTLEGVSEVRTLVISERIHAETVGRIAGGDIFLSATAQSLRQRDRGLSEGGVRGCAHAAAAVLRDAPQAGNGSTADAHVLALAWRLSADIWTHDRDFAGRAGRRGRVQSRAGAGSFR